MRHLQLTPELFPHPSSLLRPPAFQPANLAENTGKDLPFTSSIFSRPSPAIPATGITGKLPLDLPLLSSTAATAAGRARRKHPQNTPAELLYPSATFVSRPHRRNRQTPNALDYTLSLLRPSTKSVNLTLKILPYFPYP